MILRRESNGYMVSVVQQTLSTFLFSEDIVVDGVFGLQTEKIVKIFQNKNNLTVDGIVGRNTWQALGILDSDQYETESFYRYDVDNELRYGGKQKVSRRLEIEKYYLDSDEYIRDKGYIKPTSVFLHHTAGWNNPVNTAHGWNVDSRGRVGTQFVMGGKSITGEKDNVNDGRIIQCFPNNYNAYHLGKIGDSKFALKAIGIEICNFGRLEKVGEKYYTWPAFDWKGNLRTTAIDLYEVAPSEVYYFEDAWRGSHYYHKYSKKQIENLKHLLRYLNREIPTLDLANGIPSMLSAGINHHICLSFNPDAFFGRVMGLWSHSNVRADKSDISPQAPLMEMLNKLNF